MDDLSPVPETTTAECVLEGERAGEQGRGREKGGQKKESFNPMQHETK